MANLHTKWLNFLTKWLNLHTKCHIYSGQNATLKQNV